MDKQLLFHTHSFLHSIKKDIRKRERYLSQQNEIHFKFFLTWEKLTQIIEKSSSIFDSKIFDARESFIDLKKSLNRAALYKLLFF